MAKHEELIVELQKSFKVLGGWYGLTYVEDPITRLPSLKKDERVVCSSWIASWQASWSLYAKDKQLWLKCSAPEPQNIQKTLDLTLGAMLEYEPCEVL